MELPSAFFKHKLEKVKKKSTSKKVLYISGNESFWFYLILEFSYIFSKERFSNISGNGNPEKFFIFQEAEHSYISGNGTFL